MTTQVLNLDRTKLIALAWKTWHVRHGGKLGPGPAFTEVIDVLTEEILKELNKNE